MKQKAKQTVYQLQQINLQIPLKTATKVLLIAMEPVSYTHLDVYKRQNVFPALFNVGLNLPDMTVQDFITSVIKMFNLVIIPVTNPQILSLLQCQNVYQLEYFNQYYNLSLIHIQMCIRDSLKHKAYYHLCSLHQWQVPDF